MTPHTAQYFLAAPRQPQHVLSCSRHPCGNYSPFSLCPPGGRGVQQVGAPRQCEAPRARPEPQHIPLEHTGRTLLILGRVISMEERIMEPLRFGAPARTFQRRTHLRALPSAPLNARCDVLGRIGHGSPPLLDRSNAEVRPVCLVATVPVAVTGVVPVTFHTKAQGGYHGSSPSASVHGDPYVPISCSASMARQQGKDRIAEERREGNL